MISVGMPELKTLAEKKRSARSCRRCNAKYTFDRRLSTLERTVSVAALVMQYTGGQSLLDVAVVDYHVLALSKSKLVRKAVPNVCERMKHSNANSEHLIADENRLSPSDCS